jgi:4-hydroxybenzoate polyprenyltransferase
VNRWWIYQRERFPVLVFGAFLGAVCAGVLAFSARSRGADAPSLHAFGVAFVTTFLVFLELRVADEFKDFEDDAAARPYRPVQRGLVRLSELRVVAIIAVIVQLILVATLDFRLLVPFAIVLGYLGLMTREFFIPRWLRARPRAYLVSHQLVLPLIYFFIAACDWVPANGPYPHGLGWILAAGYASGNVGEIGRKIRSPGDEETGVETYSVLWGRHGAVIAWLAVVVLSGVCVVRAAFLAGAGRVVLAVALVLFVVLAAIAVRFLARPVPGAGKRIDVASGLWIVAIHGALGASLLL